MYRERRGRRRTRRAAWVKRSSASAARYRSGYFRGRARRTAQVASERPVVWSYYQHVLLRVLRCHLLAGMAADPCLRGTVRHGGRFESDSQRLFGVAKSEAKQAGYAGYECKQAYCLNFHRRRRWSSCGDGPSKTPRGVLSWVPLVNTPTLVCRFLFCWLQLNKQINGEFDSSRPKQESSRSV